MDQAAILVVDDDREIVEIVRSVLQAAGYGVTAAYHGAEALAAMKQGSYQLILLDVMMPGMNGIETAVKIRQQSNVPILMLAAKSEQSDKVVGLQTGADDYLTKPFYREELLARVQSLQRRYTVLGSAAEQNQSGILTYFDLRLDTKKCSLTVRDREVRLTATEYRILKMLLSHPGRVYGAEEIYESCWEGEGYAVENTVMIHISRLRKKIELDTSKPEYIKVVWGIGYKLEKQ